MAQHEIAYYYDTLKLGNSLNESDYATIRGSSLNRSQMASLAVLLARRKQNLFEKNLLQWILRENKALSGLLAQRYPTCASPFYFQASEWLQQLFAKTQRHSSIGSDTLRRLISEFVSETVPIDLVAAWLMVVCMEGLSKEDVDLLTYHMRDSGEVYDYRYHPNFSGYTLVRRYPTGALSEKVALILPSLIAAVGQEYKVISPFLVARSLGFTGGTWSKLSAIPGFKFPLPGDETVDILKRCGVAMTVTHGNLNPADRMMYQLRSVTGTIESEELIVASIASKQLAVPAHRLLMDIRYGDGAFLSDRESAKSLAFRLQQTISSEGVPTLCHLTSTPQPGGASIGNALEVAEAICVLGGGGEKWWDSRWIHEQKALALEFFCKLMFFEKPERPVRAWANMANKLIIDGTALEAFRRILEAHGVTSTLINELFEDPFAALGINSLPQVVRSVTNGVLCHFDQRGIGNFVNVTLGGGGNCYSGDFQPSTGIILAKRLGDPVISEDPLCFVFSPTGLIDEQVIKLRNYFHVL